MPSGNQEPRRDPELKRKAWLAVFLGSALFWVVVALLIWNVWAYQWADRSTCTRNHYASIVTYNNKPNGNVPSLFQTTGN